MNIELGGLQEQKCVSSYSGGWNVQGLRCQIWCLVKAFFLVHRQLSSLCKLSGGEGTQGPLQGNFYKGSGAFHEGFILMT